MTKSGTHLSLASKVLTEERAIVTPALARRWLATQVRNRNLNRRAVMAYAADMRNGDWQYTGDALRFDHDGHLLDGQHRLTALAQQEEGVALEFLVVRGLDPDTQMMMDQGAKRSTGQQLGLVGYKNANSLAAGIRLVLFWEQNKVTNRGWDEGVVASTSRILEWAEANDAAVTSAEENYFHIRQIGILPAVGMALCLKLGANYRDLVREFFASMYEMAELPKGSPLITFRRRLDRARNEKLRLDDTDQLAFLIVTWNYWTDGSPLHRLVRPTDNVWTPENFPRLDV